MIHDSPPPVISNETYNDLLKIKVLAKRVFEARTNFEMLCDELDALYAYFEEE